MVRGAPGSVGPGPLRFRHGVVLAVLLAVVACGRGSERLPPEGGREVASWEDAAGEVRRSVHSVWATRVMADRTAAFGPVGTAFAVGSDGLLLTSAHVVTGADGQMLARLHVLVQDSAGNELYEAEAVALDRGRDLALLRIADTTLVPVRWAEERAPMGTPLATIGYGLPEGGVVDTTGDQITTRFTVFPRFTAGYSSGYRTLRAGDPSTNVLELDVPLFSGVSGGPVFTADGRVVGVNWRQVLSRVGPTPFGSAIPELVVRQFFDLVRDSAGVEVRAEPVEGAGA